MAKKFTRKVGVAFKQPLTPSVKLAAVIGDQPLPRTQLVKKVWDYIEMNGLQDKKDRTQINADAKLKRLFGGKTKVNMFELPKHVSVHIEKIETPSPLDKKRRHYKPRRFNLPGAGAPAPMDDGGPGF